MVYTLTTWLGKACALIGVPRDSRLSSTALVLENPYQCLIVYHCITESVERRFAECGNGNCNELSIKSCNHLHLFNLNTLRKRNHM